MKSFFFQSKALLARIITRFGPKPNPKPRPRLKTSLPLPSPGSNALVFHLEGAVLRSFSGFPYFMLVAFEAGGLLRSLVLFLTYPLVRLAGEELGLKIMVFVAFFGLTEKSFRAGISVLPKFLLQDSASQGVEAVTRFQRKICVTDLPRVMVEGFAVDWLFADKVFGRELKVVYGYFVGLMEEDINCGDVALDGGLFDSGLVAMIGSTTSFNRCIHQRLLSRCKEVYEVSESEKKSWEALDREKYPKPLIFHDGRLAFKPAFPSFLEMLIWLPFGIFLVVARLSIVLSLPHEFSLPILSFTGMTGTCHVITTPKTAKGTLYVCNHRTLIDPVTLSMAIGKPVAAVTYSLSRVSELLSPIRTVRLSRSRARDAETMERLLGRSDLVVCPEGTTCREPYLLRFSPMFAELTDEIVPVAVDFRSGMFYGTTAGGFKFLDPVFLLLNPRTECTVRVLEKLPRRLSCGAGGKSSVEVANYVQGKIGEALGFECTNFTRKDKYIVLAGNEGRV